MADGEDMDETACLLSSPANAARLIESIRELREGKREEHELVEAED